MSYNTIVMPLVQFYDILKLGDNINITGSCVMGDSIVFVLDGDSRLHITLAMLKESLRLVDHGIEVIASCIVGSNIVFGVQSDYDSTYLKLNYSLRYIVLHVELLDLLGEFDCCGGDKLGEGHSWSCKRVFQ